MTELTDAELPEIESGFTVNGKTGACTCLFCGAAFEKGEIYRFGSRFFEAGRAVGLHVAQEHGGVLPQLLALDKKLTGITKIQTELLLDFSRGLSDPEIAAKNGVAQATVRHQRFVFREKARQAKLLLAILDLALAEPKAADSTLVRPHSGATMLDSRYETTELEQRKILASCFETGEPRRLRRFPVREKQKIVVLREIARMFEQGRTYREKEVNALLRGIYDDYATIRRYLIEYGFMERTPDCSEYRLKG